MHVSTDPSMHISTHKVVIVVTNSSCNPLLGREEGTHVVPVFTDSLQPSPNLRRRLDDPTVHVSTEKVVQVSRDPDNVVRVPRDLENVSADLENLAREQDHHQRDAALPTDCCAGGGLCTGAMLCMVASVVCIWPPSTVAGGYHHCAAGGGVAPASL